MKRPFQVVALPSRCARVTLPEQATAQSLHKSFAGFPGNCGVWQECLNCFWNIQSTSILLKEEEFMEKPIIEVHVYALEREGDEKFCRYNELFLGWWSRASGCFEGQRRLDFSGVRAQCSKKRASFLLDFEVVSSSSHRWHNILGWFVAFGSFWPGENKWRAVKPCESWSLISGVQISYHFRLLPFFPLTPSIYSTWEECYCLFFFFSLYLSTLLRGVGLGKALCPSFSPNGDGWAVIRKFIASSFSFSPYNRPLKLMPKWAPEPKLIHSMDDSRSPLRWEVSLACGSPAGVKSWGRGLSWGRAAAPPLALSHPALVSFNPCTERHWSARQGFHRRALWAGFSQPRCLILPQANSAGVSPCVWKFIFSINKKCRPPAYSLLEQLAVFISVVLVW